MKAESAACLAAALLIHAGLLFGFRMGTTARPLVVSDEPPSTDVSLVEAAPAPEPAAEPPAPAPSPAQPEPTPEPANTPQPESTPDMSTPPPEPTPDEESIPAPDSTPIRRQPKPVAHHHPSIPHTAPGSAASLAGTSSHAGPPHGTANAHSSSSSGSSSLASYLNNPRPDYPQAARDAHQQGVTLLTVEVSAEGHPIDVTLYHSSGYPLLDDAATRAVRRWLFEPARIGGLPVASQIHVPVHFYLSR